MDSELAIVGQIWQYDHQHYFVVSFDGTDNDSLTGDTRYWYTLLAIDPTMHELIQNPIIKYDTWNRITEMSRFKQVC